MRNFRLAARVPGGMLRFSGALATLVLLMGAAAALPSGPSSATSPAPAALVVPHAISPVVASYGDDAVALVQRAGDGALMAYQESGGAWGPPTNLTPDAATAGIGAPQLVLAANGVGAAVWFRETGGRDANVVRLHRADGSWGSPHVMPRVDWLQGIVVNDQGEVAVIGWADSHYQLLVHVDGRWHAARLAGDGDAVQLGIDDSGVVHLADVFTDRGGEGTITVRHWTVDGGWTSPDTVTQPDEMVPGMSFAVQPDGTEYVGVGTVSDRWKSTWDTEAFWPTAYYVMERAPGASWRKVWHRDGAEGLQMVADATNVRLLWQQQTDPDRQRRPQRLSLVTRMLGPDSRADDGAPHRLAGTKGNGGQMERTDFEATLAPTAGDRPGIAWRVHGPVNDLSKIAVWDYDGTRHLDTAYSGPRVWGLGVSVAPLPGWVAYASRTVAKAERGVVDGTVKVVPIS